MGLRHVARTVHSMALGSIAIVVGFSTTVALAADVSDGANVRIATYQTPTGEGYFAASIQPSADDALLEAVRSHGADIVVVVDTSATQVGEFRTASIAALRGIIGKLRAEDRVRIFAADVKATDLSGSFGTGEQTDEAIAKLKKRLPLGNTNLMSAIDVVRASLVSQPSDRTRSIVYIGDGTSIDALGNEARFAALIDALRADHIAVHSVAIGATRNIELLAILANQTGGVFGVVGDDADNDAVAIANRVGGSAKMSPIWLSEVKLLDGMKSLQADRLPPLRLDRDSILIGNLTGEASGGSLELIGKTTGSTVQILAEVVAGEESSRFRFPAWIGQARRGEPRADVGLGWFWHVARDRAGDGRSGGRTGPCGQHGVATGQSPRGQSGRRESLGSRPQQCRRPIARANHGQSIDHSEFGRPVWRFW